MKTILPILIAVLASQSFAQPNSVSGRIVCDVLASRFVPTSGASTSSNTSSGTGFVSGATLIIDYTHDVDGGLSMYLGAPNRTNILIEEPFPASSFKGISQITKIAEFRSTYSEVSLGKFSLNYKGNDQLSLRKCNGDGWHGHFVQTYVSGHFTQVVSLNCHPLVDVIDEVLARLKPTN